MPKRHRSLEIYAPTLGIKSDAPTNLLDPRAQVAGQNFKCYYGVNQKEYGTSLYATGSMSVMTSTPTFIYDAQFPNSTILQVLTPTNVYAYTGGVDNYVIDGQTFTGTYSDFWSGIMHNDAFFYTNGVNPIQVKTSFSATGTNLASAVSPTTYQAWSLVSLKDHLCLYHTIENGSENYKRVQWSLKGPLTLSAGTTDFDSGTAGAIDLQDAVGEIRAAVPLNAGAAIYCERSIHLQTWIGGDQIFQFDRVSPNIGIPGRRCVFSYLNVNYILSHNNVFAFDGASLQPIGDPVKKAMFSEINAQAIGTSFLDYDPAENELFVNVPTQTATQPNVCWVYRITDDTWARKVREHSCAGRFSRKSGLTIGELVGSIGAQNYTFGEALVRIDAEIKLFGDPSGRLVQHDVARYSVSQTGTNIAQTYSVETPDFVGAKVQGSLYAQRSQDPIDGDVVEYTITAQRWQRTTIEALGNGQASVYYSTDRGSTYREFDQSPIMLISTGTAHMLDMDVANPFVRLKITSTGQNDFFGWRYAKLDFIPGGNV